MNFEKNVSSIRKHEEQLDFKITKRHYPRVNNDSILEFIFEKDPNLFMRKNKIVIRGAIEVDQKVLPERCCWTAGRFGKLFSILTVEVDYKMFPPIVSSKHYVSYHMVHTVWLVSYDV